MNTNKPITTTPTPYLVPAVVEVIQELYQCDTLPRLLKEKGLAPIEFFTIIYANPALYQKYCEAQKARSELFAEEIISIADTEEDYIRARNRIDARKWYAAKMQPGKFGDKLDLSISSHVDINAALLEAKARTLTISSTCTTDQPTKQLDNSGITDIEEVIDIFS